MEDEAKEDMRVYLKTAERNLEEAKTCTMAGKTGIKTGASRDHLEAAEGKFKEAKDNIIAAAGIAMKAGETNLCIKIMELADSVVDRKEEIRKVRERIKTNY